MGKVYFWTMAYNNAATVPRCVDSILNQTKYGDQIEYWFCVNGSTDNTRELIEEYAKRDPRIKIFYNEKNHEWNEQSSVFWDLTKLMNDDDFCCTLDSDDFYDLDFLEKMIPFILENDLDFAMTGSDFFDAKTGKVLGRRALSQTLILDTPQKFVEYFHVYHQFARTIWSKVYRGRAAKYMATRNNMPIELWNTLLKYGYDTYMLFSVLKHCDRVGIFPGTLHKYQVSIQSESYKWYNDRFNCDRILYEDAEEFLNKFGPISEQNRIFLDHVYANALFDSIKVLTLVQGMAGEEKLKELRKAIDCRITSNVISLGYPDIQKTKKSIFDAALKFGLELKEENEDLKSVLELICPRCAPYVSVDDLELYSRDNVLNNLLFNDDKTELANQIMHISKMYTNTAKKFSSVAGS